ncbi:MAG: GH3 auxin-responsive promoter [Brachybacterium faecium]|nr:MAG: GH3 auxin-responsive promoter [Brachybacterium faecium]
MINGQMNEQFRTETRRSKARFLESLANPANAQRIVLQDLENITAEAMFWNSGAARLDSLSAFKASVPIREYSDFEAAIDKEVVTRGGVLTCSPVLRWLKTSGTTGKAKKIPYSQHWMRQYRVPAMHAMWDTFLTVAPQILLHEHSMLDTQSVREAVPPTIHGLSHQAISNRHPQIDCRDWNPPWYNAPWYGPDVPATHAGRMYMRLRHFLGMDLRGITAINPSTIISMADILESEAECLARDLADGTILGSASRLDPMPKAAKHLLEVVGRNDWSFNDHWSRLSFLSCWTSASAGQYLPRLKELAPRATIAPFMTCGTEGVVTIPINTELESQPLAVNQGVYEFIPAETDPSEWLGTPASTLEFNELEEGRRYHLVMSQGHGLLRLWTRDIFEVTEMRQGVPWLRFIERHGVFHSFTGEKLTHTDVAGL